MSGPKPKLPWYQFSLRSMLVVTAYVAIVCSIRFYSGTLTTIVIIGGLAGIIVAGRPLGFVAGAIGGSLSYLIAAVFPIITQPWKLDLVWWVWATIWIDVLIGGILGGLTVRLDRGKTARGAGAQKRSVIG
jgi:hypothetical protein